MKKKLTPENLSILIVDDVKSMRSVIRSMLKNLKIGKRLFMAQNGAEGLKMLHTNPIDIAIIDWKMPVMNGAQLLEAIRRDRALRDIPVLMVTAESEKDIVLEAAEIEVEAYLIKPLTPVVLENRIRQVIDQMNRPDKATLHARRARELEEKNDIDMAIRHMKRAVALKPGASRLLRKLALLYREKGDDSQLVEYLKKAVTANSQDAVSLKILGDYYWEKDELPTALNYYLDVVAMTRKFHDNAIELGQALLKKDQLQNAKLLFSSIIAQSLRNAKLIENIVNICMGYNEYAYSLTLLKKLLRISPHNYELMCQAGKVCEKMDNQDEALRYYMQVDRYSHARLHIKLAIARIFIYKKRVIQADNYLNQVLDKDPENKEALRLRRLI